jgi:AraC-type DNA-binding domain-containing proteins
MTQYYLSGFTATTGDVDVSVESIITINYFLSSTTITFPEGLQNFWHLLYVDRGEATFFRANEPTALSQRQILLISPDNQQPQYIKTTPSTNLISIAFASESSALGALEDQAYTLNEKERKLLSSFIREAETDFESKLEDSHSKGLKPATAMPPGAWQVLKSILELILLYLYRTSTWKDNQEWGKHLSVKDRTEYLRMADIISFLEENVHRKLTLDDICKAAFMSRSALQKLFKQHTGDSVIGYFITLKTNEAKRLLTDGRYSISAISDLLGYNSIHYFSRQFKQVTGFSPSEYTRNPGLESEAG